MNKNNRLHHRIKKSFKEGLLDLGEYKIKYKNKLTEGILQLFKRSDEFGKWLIIPASSFQSLQEYEDSFEEYLFKWLDNFNKSELAIQLKNNSSLNFTWHEITELLNENEEE